VLLFEVLFFLFKSFYVVTVLIFPDIAQDLNNAAHAWHAQLLVKSVVRGCALGPELRLASSGFVLVLGCALGFSFHLLDNHLGP
jgi:hypothetical protein